MTTGTLIAGLLTLILFFIILSFGKSWGVKYNFTGSVMIKYAVIAYLVKIVLTGFFIYAIVPIFFNIANHIDSSEILDYWLILKNFGIMLLSYLVAIGIEMFFAFVILIPTVKKLEFD